MKNLSADYISECLRYDPKDGLLYWKERPSEHFANESYQARWNKRYAGERAGKFMMNGYLKLAIDNKKYYAHRIVWVLKKKEWPQYIDHINGDRSDNRIENLRNVSRSQNQRNLKLSVRNTTGVIGVTQDSRNGHYIAQVKIGDKNIHLGSFKNLSDAAEARAKANIEYGFHENHGRKSSSEAA
ncbi:HNH endonuclease [Cronobacter dublinensis]|uniref:HNH endonuclease n=1 Tax=Cronobacter dublinensis TaxID=413497 RepID=UPI00300DE0D8